MFSLTLLWDRPFILVLGRYIVVLLSIFPNKVILGYPNTILLEELYWGTAGDALSGPAFEGSIHYTQVLSHSYQSFY
jgi:hypothetical protein